MSSQGREPLPLPRMLSQCPHQSRSRPLLLSGSVSPLPRGYGLVSPTKLKA